MEYIAMDRQAVCRTEIDSAIHLFLYRDDLIAAHMLASAALEIMTALSGGDKTVGINRMRALLTEHDVPKDIMDEVFSSLSHPYNFSKHSSSDSSVVNDYPIEQMIMNIYTAIYTYKSMFGEITPEMNTLYGILISWKIHWWEGVPGQDELRRIAERLGLSGKSRAEVQAFGRLLLLQQRAAQ
ncbi:MAG: hypothetical protein ACKVON_09635 [Beijerinckiaceae bacterium]